ncbi:endonuclease/exonuclease/phosphatase family protein [Actinosynnema pretiosum subsp. pretiosum]|uniref:Endonuclease/exonuclease/phosphatase n=2 Tax=Actinosynnema TaxID=40566 RepID=C6WGJ0_ACTMD|nr:endonuclease/exonuclease/phosphatase family protein [Actinosynnema mirum]ACU34306.1 Endonuclease/exonuclease/phosphatase [Actinosynnema mirum DSM 43827]QUF01620.1 endonuclease/exonuclease/phosphatase family protein [Actinosynnema pretiosum subsp. pretiosum]
MIEAPARRVGGRTATALVVLLAVGFLVPALTRLLGVDGNRYLAATTALTPLVTAAGVLVGALALLLRRWPVALVVLPVCLLLAASVTPRAIADDRPAGAGLPLRVMASNFLVGKADAEAVVREVVERDVDVLAMQELSPAMVRDLENAGLDAVLPHRAFEDEPGGSGSGIASRYPLTPARLVGPSSFRQASAVVELPNGKDVEVVSVHPMPPVEPQGPAQWRRDLAALPPRNADGPIRVLAGDFNATLDHAPLRRLLDTGYADAADRVGAGLTPTWPNEGVVPPLVALDHVLVDDRCPVDWFTAVDVPGSDHRAVVAQFVVPD